MQWLRDGLGIIKSAAEIEALARKVSSSEGVTFVPALAGLGAPYWDSGGARHITGITRGTTRAHLARATLEGIASPGLTICSRAMADDVGTGSRRMRVDGGAAAERSADAVPVRPVGRGRRAPGRARVDRARRGDARRARGRSLRDQSPSGQYVEGRARCSPLAWTNATRVRVPVRLGDAVAACSLLLRGALLRGAAGWDATKVQRSSLASA